MRNAHRINQLVIRTKEWLATRAAWLLSALPGEAASVPHTKFRNDLHAALSCKPAGTMELPAELLKPGLKNPVW
jgi:hypothetical protein